MLKETMLKVSSDQLRLQKRVYRLVIGILIGMLIGFILAESISSLEKGFLLKNMFLGVTCVSVVMNFIFMKRISAHLKTRE